MRGLASRSTTFRQAGALLITWQAPLTCPFTPQCLIFRQRSVANAAPASHLWPIPAYRPVASPLPLRYLSVAPPDTHRRFNFNLRCVSGGATEGLRRDYGDVRQSARRFRAPRVAGSRYVSAFMKRANKPLRCGWNEERADPRKKVK
jgi:hypothetical protein